MRNMEKVTCIYQYSPLIAGYNYLTVTNEYTPIFFNYAIHRTSLVLIKFTTLKS